MTTFVQVIGLFSVAEHILEIHVIYICYVSFPNFLNSKQYNNFGDDIENGIFQFRLFYVKIIEMLLVFQ